MIPGRAENFLGMGWILLRSGTNDGQLAYRALGGLETITLPRPNKPLSNDEWVGTIGRNSVEADDQLETEWRRTTRKYGLNSIVFFL